MRENTLNLIEDILAQPTEEALALLSEVKRQIGEKLQKEITELNEKDKELKSLLSKLTNI